MNHKRIQRNKLPNYEYKLYMSKINQFQTAFTDSAVSLYKEVPNESTRKFAFIASTDMMDRAGDVIEMDAWRKTLREWKTRGDVPIFWQHKAEYSIGKCTKLRLTKEGLVGEAELNMEDDDATKVWNKMKGGSVQFISIGGMVKNAVWMEPAVQAKTGVWRKITEMDLMEISLVANPANPQARVTQLSKAMDLGFGEEEAEEVFFGKKVVAKESDVEVEQEDKSTEAECVAVESEELNDKIAELSDVMVKFSEAVHLRRLRDAAVFQRHNPKGE